MKKNKTKIKITRKPLREPNIIKKFWDFIWNGTGLLSWITFLIVIFVVIKFVFFPALSLITGSSLPIVIVESCSMYHGDKFDVWWQDNKNWYESHGIDKEEFEKFSIKNGFTKGDIFIVGGINKENVKVGDIIIFTSGEAKRPIIHRVINLDPLITKGDNGKTNPDSAPFEKDISEKEIIGKASVFRIPLLGWAKLIFFEPFRSNNDKGFC